MGSMGTEGNHGNHGNRNILEFYLGPSFVFGFVAILPRTFVRVWIRRHSSAWRQRCRTGDFSLMAALAFRGVAATFTSERPQSHVVSEPSLPLRAVWPGS